MVANPLLETPHFDIKRVRTDQIELPENSGNSFSMITSSEEQLIPQAIKSKKATEIAAVGTAIPTPKPPGINKNEPTQNLWSMLKNLFEPASKIQPEKKQEHHKKPYKKRSRYNGQSKNNNRNKNNRYQNSNKQKNKNDKYKKSHAKDVKSSQHSHDNKLTSTINNSIKETKNSSSQTKLDITLSLIHI